MQEESKPVFDLIQHFKKAFSSLSPVIGNEVVNFSKDNFRMQGFTDTAFDPWKARSDNSWGKKNDEGRAILHKSGTLERSIHVISHNEYEVVVGSSAEVPYAQAHNEGFEGQVTQNVKSFTRKTIKGVSTVKAHTRTIHQHIPKREFLGKSEALLIRMKNISSAHFKKYINL